MLKVILRDIGMLSTDNCKVIKDFEKSLSVMEILANILKTQEIPYAREEFRTYYELDEYNEILEKSLDVLDDIYEDDDIDNEDYDDQMIDELREDQYLALSQIYSYLYYHKFSPPNRDACMAFKNKIGWHIISVAEELSDVDFNDRTTFRVSDIM